jgi:hypothetical protein
VHETTNASGRRLLLPALLSVLGVLCAPAAIAQNDAPRPITGEPEHKIRFDNGSVRVYVLFLPAGKATLMHEHAADSFNVVFSNAEMTNQSFGGTPATFFPPAGFVGFTPAPRPYAHRVAASGQSPFHVAALELISPAGGAPRANQRTNPAFSMVVENARGRAYHYSLAPGASTGAFARAGNTAVFAVSGGRISETLEGKPPRLWDVEPGHFKWLQDSERLSIRNEGAAPIQLVDIEVF